MESVDTVNVENSESRLRLGGLRVPRSPQRIRSINVLPDVGMLDIRKFRKLVISWSSSF